MIELTLGLLFEPSAWGFTFEAAKDNYEHTKIYRISICIVFIQVEAAFCRHINEPK